MTEPKEITIDVLKFRCDAMFEGIKLLQVKINRENGIGNNWKCTCGSGKKWKKCCKVTHDEETIRLECSIKNYQAMCVAYNRRIKNEHKILGNKGKS